MATRLAPADAQTFWMSAKVPNDQFLLYAFDGTPRHVDSAVATIRDRARVCDDLRLRIADDNAVRYPVWTDSAVDDGQVVTPDLDDPTWAGCLDAVTRLAADEQLDARQMTWRLYVFPGLDGVPLARGPAAVVVLQMVHALADGTRSAELAALLLGRDLAVPPIAAEMRGCLLPLSVRAARSHRRLVADTAAGTVPAPGQPRPALLTNNKPVGFSTVRTLVRHRAELGGPTVTIAVLSAVSAALAGYLSARGDDVSTLGAEVPMAHPGIRHAHNHFGNVGIGLYPELSAGRRANRIVDELADRRRRAQHPAIVAASRAFAAAPAALLRWGVGQFDPDTRPPLVSGNTVVSSVNRGAADLSFGAAPVILTAGCPALSPMMSLVHGVHGIGDVVAVSVHASKSVIGLDDYVERLAAALGQPITERRHLPPG